MFHGTGTGKTCTAITIAEQFANVFFKQHYVLCASALKDNFKRQIFDETKAHQCTGATYKDASNPASKIKQQWELKSFNEFAKTYKRLKDRATQQKQSFDQVLKDAFSNRVFIVDEAHNVRLSTEAKEKEVPPKLEHVLRVAENVKLLLLTATPMYNTASEIVFLLNLLLLNDKRPTLTTADIFDAKGRLTSKGRSRLAEASRGYVSFNTADNPYTFPFRLYPDSDPMLISADDAPSRDMYGKKLTSYGPIHEFHIRKSYMEGHQATVYAKLQKSVKAAEEEDAQNDDNNNDDNAQNDDDDDAKNKSGLSVLVQASIIAYPCSTSTSKTLRYAYGREGFQASFVEHTHNNTYKLSYRNADYEFLRRDTLGQHSAKIKSVVEYIKKSTGVVFVYSAYLYNGLVPLALALEHEGFTKHGNNLLNAGTRSARFKIDSKFPATYVMITGSQRLSPDNAMEIALARDPSNAHGHRVKVILASNVATEGVDFKFIREVHVLEPWYHFNKLEQAFGRAIRHCSHMDLPPEKRNVTMYQHASVTEDGRETIDMRMYNIAITKQLAVDDVTGLLKENAVNAMLVERRFPRKPQKVKIVTSQGEKGTYTIHSQESPVRTRTPDKSTFHPEMERADIDAYKASIKAAFANGRCTYSYADMKAHVHNSHAGFDEEVLMFALQEMIDQQTPIVVKDRSGVMSYTSNKYVFSLTDSKRTKQMDMYRCAEDEGDGPLVKKVRLSGMAAAAPAPRAPKQTTPQVVPQAPPQATAATPQGAPQAPVGNTTGASNEVVRLIREVSSLFNEAHIDKELKVAIIDFAIDRISCKGQMHLIETLKKTDVVRERLLKLPHFLKGQYFVEFEEGTVYYELTARGKFQKVPVLHHRVVSKLEDQIGINLEETLFAFLSFKKGAYQFKMLTKDAKQKAVHLRSFGSVCVSTSTITAPEMKRKISDVAALAVMAKEKTPKKGLCEAYEVLLRRYQPDMMMRPYHVHLVNQVKK